MNLEGSMQPCGGVRADPEVKARRLLHPPLLRCAPVAQFFFAQRKTDGALLSCGKRDPLEALQLAHRARGAARLLMQVKLHHFVACTAAVIGNVNADLKHLAELDLGLLEPNRREGELRIAQAVAEWIKRRCQFIPI